MAITHVNTGGATHGNDYDEAGLNVSDYSVSYKPEFKKYLFNRLGEKRGFVVAEPEAEITLSGETLGTTTGVMAFTFAAAVAISNSASGFGLTTGSIYLDDVKIATNRDGWKSYEAKLSRNAGF